MQIPYLSGALRTRFDAWLGANRERYEAELTFTEIRKGVQALGELYAERRGQRGLAEKASEGRGKRAAHATYFAALHFLTTCHAIEMADPETFGRVRRIHDLGCGTGATGAAAALSLPAPVRVTGYDCSRWALDEARASYGVLGVDGRTQRAELPEGFPRAGRGDLLALGWTLSELPAAARRVLVKRIVTAAKRGAALLVLEPLSLELGDWWFELARELEALGIGEFPIRVSIERPRFIQHMDKAARLDHQVVGARLLAGARPEPGR